MRYEVTLERILKDYAVVDVDAHTSAEAERKARRIVDREPERFTDGEYTDIVCADVSPKGTIIDLTGYTRSDGTPYK